MKIAWRVVGLRASTTLRARALAPVTVRFVALLVSFSAPLFGSASGVAHADAPTRAQQDEAQRAMELGVAATARGDHAAALAQYARAGELVPEANLPYRFAAEALEHLGRYDDAIASYEAYLRVKATVRDADKVRARIAEIRAQHIDGRLEVVSNPDGGAVFVDEATSPLGATPLDDVTVRAGEHTVRVRLLGYREARVTTRVLPGSKVVVHCELEAVRDLAVVPLHPVPATPPAALALAAPSPAPIAPIAPIAPAAPPWYARWYIWAGAGTAVAAALVTTLVITGGADPPATQGGVHRFPDGP